MFYAALAEPMSGFRISEFEEDNVSYENKQCGTTNDD